KKLTGPPLGGFESRGPWSDRQEVYDWIHNPSAYIAKNDYAKALKNEYGSEMTPFPALSTAEIDAIVDYINTTFAAGDGKSKPEDPDGPPAPKNQNALIFGVISLILAIIALILMQVNSNLKKLSDDAEGIH